MRFRGLSGIFSRVSPLSGWSLIAAASVLIFDLTAAAAGPNANPTLRIGVTLVPVVQTTQNTTPVVPSATTLNSSDSQKEITVEIRNLPQGPTLSASQSQGMGAQQSSAQNAVLETLTVVSP